MICRECDKARANPHHGTYRADCLDCCARLVASARSIGRRQQDILLDAIARFPSPHKREEIINHLKRTPKIDDRGQRTEDRRQSGRCAAFVISDQ
ncbi:MAG: hypothetical protein LBI59_00565 [Candidatus Accumulibacter sp.]|jgi:hypothetical protein|nr:hypothetical protein [Accumulibacter sp.]